MYVLKVPPAPELPEILTSTVVPLTANVFPSPIKLSWVIPAPIWTPPDWIPICDGPLNNVAVTTPALPSWILFPTVTSPAGTLIPVLAVTMPSESTFLTSS